MTQPIPSLSSLFKLEYPQSVGVYGTYDEAQRVVDFLADARFPVENLCIVGTELRSMERVLGRRSWGTVIGAGVQTGLTTGVMITLVLWILQPATDFLLLVASALAIGVFVGVVSSAFGYWLSQGKRDFRSVSQTIATKYEVLAEHKVAGQARELVAKMPGARAAQFTPGAPAAPGPQGYPPAGYPQQGYPQQGFAQQPYPQLGYPQGYQQPVPGAYPEQPGYGQPYPPQPYPPQYPASPPNSSAPAAEPAPDAEPSRTAESTPDAESTTASPKSEDDKE